ncbi:conjugative transposon protein TraK [Persicobacter diffluens]|uniref:Conjugative transposon protein TraK n=1 Tax=Persicobacter diffluens TaxID=981 RepID=A0AAN4W4R7_9BACT|nr:conjugative transposon protein TraK [Persicobacter diffluens]
MLLQKIENKIRLAVWVSVGSFVTSILIVILILVFTNIQLDKTRKNIYVLDEATPILAKQVGTEANRMVEYQSHVNIFHLLFWTLAPDDKMIKRNIGRSMYLGDESVHAEYNNISEKGFYNQLISSTTTVTIEMDSVNIDPATLEFVYYGTQRFERETGVSKRKIKTTGVLKDVIRTDNNPHGVLITQYLTLENKSISDESKRLF